VLGGLARRVAFVEKMQREFPDSLVLDSGDLFFSREAILPRDLAQKKARLIARAYKRMGAAAVNVGDLDLLFGPDFLRQEAKAGLPLVSANLLDSSTKAPIFSPFVIREVAGIRIAFFGLLTQDSPPEIAPIIKEALGGKILIQDPQEAARQTVQRIAGRADLVVLLSDLGLPNDQMLARSVPGIHFILGGHDGVYLRWPQKIGNTYIFQSARKGMYVGTLRLTLEDPHAPFEDEGKIDRIKDQINGLDYRLRALERAKAQHPERTDQIERSISQVNRQKADLEKEVRQAEQAGVRGNRFIFTLESLGTAVPEDEAVKRWILDAGFAQD
jgi:2',3'-cyclic-nucleotide 2'-phosphodiesterase (5'-nucleotidase family)